MLFWFRPFTSFSNISDSYTLIYWLAIECVSFIKNDNYSRIFSLNKFRVMKKLEKLKQSKIVNANQIKGGLTGKGSISLGNDIGGGVMATFQTGNDILADGSNVPPVMDSCTRPF